MFGEGGAGWTKTDHAPAEDGLQGDEVRKHGCGTAERDKDLELYLKVGGSEPWNERDFFILIMFTWCEENKGRGGKRGDMEARKRACKGPSKS